MVFTIVSVVLIVLCIIFGIKNEITNNKRNKIIEAIHEHHIDCFVFCEKELVDYDDMRSYYASLLRIWNWGYTSIIKKEKLKIIKPYIK